MNRAMWIINVVVGKIFDVVFLPFRRLDPWFGMIVVSFLTGLLMLFIFGRTSNQDGIRRTKAKIKAHLLELRLYKESLGQSLRSQGSIFAANFKYIGYALKPMLVMMIPVLLILVQLNLWFGSLSLSAGQAAIVKVKLKEGTSPLRTDIRLEAPEGVDVETPALRLEESREIDWRLRAEKNGLHVLAFHWGAETFTKSLGVGQYRLSRVPAVKPGPGFFAVMANPGEKPLAANLPVESVEVAYFPQRLSVFGLHLHWLGAFLVLSIVFGFAFKGVFKVDI